MTSLDGPESPVIISIAAIITLVMMKIVIKELFLDAGSILKWLTNAADTNLDSLLTSTSILD